MTRSHFLKLSEKMRKMAKSPKPQQRIFKNEKKIDISFEANLKTDGPKADAMGYRIFRIKLNHVF